MGRAADKNLDSTIQILKLILLIFNIITFVFGVIIFSLSLWMRYDKEIREYIEHSDIYLVWAGIYVLCAVGAFLIIHSFFGVCGIFLESRSILFGFMFALFVLFILELIGVGITLGFATRSGNLESLLNDRIRKMITGDSENKEILDLIQTKLGCCGATGDNDYVKYNKNIPDSCRNKETGNDFREGCVTKFSKWLDAKSAAIAGMTLTILFGQVFEFLMIFFLIRKLKESEDKGLLYDPVRKNPNQVAYDS